MKDKLSQEATTALAAGMSYGKWKAKQEVVIPVKKDLPEGGKYCAYCAEMFKASTKQQRYCVACKKKVKAEKMREYRAQNKGERKKDG